MKYQCEKNCWYRFGKVRRRKKKKTITTAKATTTTTTAAAKATTTSKTLFEKKTPQILIFKLKLNSCTRIDEHARSKYVKNFFVA
jgi:hypothetical protein